ncbi:plastin-2-like [Montipora capricornis]|uniref:plastin-2-like n=1 Tax=Montipora capricornis TaxID=246305 RepID=UPI0035F138AE
MAELKMMFSNVRMQEMKLCFEKYAANGKLKCDDFGNVMKDFGEEIAGYQLRQIMEEVQKEKGGLLTFDDFTELFSKLSTKVVGGRYKHAVDHREGVQQMEDSSGTRHSFSDDEQVGFSDWINSVLEDDPDLKGKHLPIKEEDRDALFKAVKDGILLCKLINWAVPGTVDERAINKKKLNVYNIHENQTLVLNSAMAIGCNIVNIGAEDLIEGKPHLVLGLMWQVIRIGLFANLTIHKCPGIVRLVKDDETIEELLRLPPEAILLRWFNYQLQEAGHVRQVANFSSDISDAENYSVLLHQIAPRELGIDQPHVGESDPTKLAGLVLENAKKMNCRKFVRVKDIVRGNTKLNLAFVCNLFNNYPALEPAEEELPNLEETREEKTFRNWMNSMGVKPFVQNLFLDLDDGSILLQLFELVKVGIVDWTKVNRPPFKKLSEKMKKLENCNYAIDIAKKLEFSVVGIGGQDLLDGNKKLMLAILYQAMRAYTLVILQKCAQSDKPIKDEEIVSWVNDKLGKGGKDTRITSFKDPNISTSVCVFDLIDAIKPGFIHYNMVSKGETDDDKLSNAKYAISMARKIGAKLYALPEDLVEVKTKMVLTVFACMMAVDHALELAIQKK